MTSLMGDHVMQGPDDKNRFDREYLQVRFGCRVPIRAEGENWRDFNNEKSGMKVETSGARRQGGFRNNTLQYFHFGIYTLG